MVAAAVKGLAHVRFSFPVGGEGKQQSIWESLQDGAVLVAAAELCETVVARASGDDGCPALTIAVPWDISRADYEMLYPDEIEHRGHRFITKLIDVLASQNLILKPGKWMISINFTVFCKQAFLNYSLMTAVLKPASRFVGGSNETIPTPDSYLSNLVTALDATAEKTVEELTACIFWGGQFADALISMYQACPALSSRVRSAQQR